MMSCFQFNLTISGTQWTQSVCRHFLLSTVDDDDNGGGHRVCRSSCIVNVIFTRNYYKTVAVKKIKLNEKTSTLKEIAFRIFIK